MITAAKKLDCPGPDDVPRSPAPTPNPPPPTGDDGPQTPQRPSEPPSAPPTVEREEFERRFVSLVGGLASTKGFTQFRTCEEACNLVMVGADTNRGGAMIVQGDKD